MEVPPTVAVLGLKDGFFNRKLQQNIGGGSQGQSGSKIGGNSPLEAPFKRARVKTCLLRNETAHNIKFLQSHPPKNMHTINPYLTGLLQNRPKPDVMWYWFSQSENY